jgi:hypothetical protein
MLLSRTYVCGLGSSSGTDSSKQQLDAFQWIKIAGACCVSSAVVLRPLLASILLLGVLQQ